MQNVLGLGDAPQASAPRSRGRPSLAEAAAIDAGLLDAALREFCRHGYGGTSMRNIAREAKVSRTTLAARFSSKADLFHAIVRWQAAQVGVSVSLGEDRPADLRQGLVACVQSVIAGCVHGTLAELYRLGASSAAQFPELAEHVAEFDELSIGRIAEFIARCAEADGVPCGEPRVPARNLYMLLRGWTLGYLLEGGKTPVDESWIEPAIDALIAGRSGW